MNVTRIAIATYYLAICVFLICLVVLVMKMTFWPVCTGGSICDGWTVAGLVAAVLGVSAAFLGILGAIALAAWWTHLDKRVEDHVTLLFTTQIQAVQDSINQLTKRADELRGKMDANETGSTWLRVENNSKFVRGKRQTRARIEQSVLSQYAMEKQANG